MKRPIGLWVVIAWCVFRGVAGIWGTVNLARWVLHGYGTWSGTFLSAVEGAIWIWLAFALFTRWNWGRLLTVAWCAVMIAWASYGFMFSAPPRWNDPGFGFGYVFLLLITIHATIIGYLLRSQIARYFHRNKQAAT